jgi:outer membrane protein TolC
MERKDVNGGFGAADVRRADPEARGTFHLFHRAVRRAMSLLVLSFAMPALSFSAFAQAEASGGEAGSARRGQVIQLPLSGRTGQNGTVTSTQVPTPGTTTSVNTLNPTVATTGAFAGSAARAPFTGRLSLRDAVDRGIEYNLGAVGLSDSSDQARGQKKVVRSQLLPNLNGYLSETVRQVNLQALGLRLNQPIPIQGFSIPTIVGPFNFFDLRTTLTQTVFDLTAVNNYRSAKEIVRATDASVENARDLVVLAVGGAYLQVIAAKAKVDSERAQLQTANALYNQALQQRNAGLISQTDLNRSQIQALTEQQRLITLETDLAKMKLNLARLTGIEPTDLYDISDLVPYTPAPPIPLDEALRQAFERRADLKAAEAQVRAAEKTRAAARAERLPSFSISADYGVIGVNPSQSHGTFNVVGTLSFPIWQGGRIKGDIQQAEAALAQRRAELEDIKGQIESEVRSAFLDLQASSSQVQVALKNLQASRQNLDLARQRYDAGISDNVEVVRAQQDIATGQLDYINSLFAHNVAKLSLARAIGRAAESLPQFLRIQ